MYQRIYCIRYNGQVKVQSISFHLPLRQTLAQVTGPRAAHVHCALKHVETAAMSAAGHTLAEHLGRKPRLARGWVCWVSSWPRAKGWKVKVSGASFFFFFFWAGLTYLSKILCRKGGMGWWSSPVGFLFVFYFVFIFLPLKSPEFHRIHWFWC